MKVNDRLILLFQFLKEGHEYNARWQRNVYRKLLAPYDSSRQKFYALLDHSMNTQSKSKIDNAGLFWKRLRPINSPSQINLGQLQRLLRSVLDDNSEFSEEPSFFQIWKILRKKNSGFGPKTAALFVKALVCIHTEQLNQDLRFIEEFRVNENDRVFLPVDTVIIHIFNEYIFSEIGVFLSTQNAFGRINDILMKFNGEDINCPRWWHENDDWNAIGTGVDIDGWAEMSSIQKMIIWDDLWCWGFITQTNKPTKKNNSKRITQLNTNKLYADFNSPSENWEAMENLAEEFIELLTWLRLAQ